MTLGIFGGRLQGLPSGSFNLTCIGQVVFDVLLNQVTLPFVLHGISISQQQHIGLVGRNFKPRLCFKPEAAQNPLNLGEVFSPPHFDTRSLPRQG